MEIITPPGAIPSPRKEDVLFRDDLPDGLNNACLNVQKDGDPIAYLEGYRRGAQRLVQYVVGKW